MALNHTLGIDVKGLPIQRSVGIRPSFIGNNRLMFITHRTARYTEAEEVRMVVEGGCSWVQLRMKDGLEKATVQACVDICTSAKTHNVDLCIDDNLETALECGATACHLGKKDMPVPEAWNIVQSRLELNKVFYVGATCNTFEDIQHAVACKASYVGLGPFRFTGTKKNLSPIIGLEGYRSIMAQCAEAGIDIPIFAIGGITLEDVAPLMQTGITGVAVSGGIINAKDPVEETRRFIEEINNY